MKTRKHVCRLGVMLAVASILVSGAAMTTYAQHNSQTSKDTPVVTDNEEPDFTVRGQYIYVNTPRQITIRLYSILGQLITQQTLQPGTTRIKAPTRGVYILKAGSMTRRITINS